jgi:hypothetical protein
VDVIVVYKVDRLTRSLADFAKLVETFDHHQVSFISVTQSFNTTSSMGRLTLNVLLSFAQFEREVIGERVRDKIAASKRKGLWVGGPVPLGYRSIAKKLIVIEEEAEQVRTIFRRYLALGSIGLLIEDLHRCGVRPRPRVGRDGGTIHPTRFMVGPLAYLLKNRFYIGEVVYRGEVHPGEQQPIVEKELFEAVQAKLKHRAVARKVRQSRSPSFLSGLLFDDRGNLMSPSHATKGGRRYRYYVSQAVLQGRKEDAGSIFRVPAMEIERRVIDAVRGATPSHISERSIGRQSIQGVGRPAAAIDGAASAAPSNVFDFGGDVRAAVERITIRRTALEIQLAQEIAGEAPDRIMLVPWTPPSPYRRREIVRGEGEQFAAVRPMRTQARVVLVDALRDAHRWLDELTTDPIRTIESIAAPEKKTERSIRMTLSLAFLSPALVKAAIDGRLPRGFGTKRLMDLPMTWSEQWSTLGLKPPAQP